MYYARALEARPGYFLAMNHYGWVLRQLNRPEEAELVFRRCLATPAETDRDRQTILDCRFYVGALRYRAEDHAATVTAMEEVLRHSPSHPTDPSVQGPSVPLDPITIDPAKREESRRRAMR